MNRLSDRGKLAAILGLGLALRAAAALLMGSAHVAWGFEYEEIAANLLQSGRYAFSFYALTPPLPTSFIPPVYPLLLYFFQWLGGAQGIGLLKAAQILLSGLSIWGVYRLALSLGANRTQGQIAALLMAVYPPVVAYAGDVSTVTVEVLLVVMGAWGAVATLRQGSVWPALGSGLAWGLAALTRSPWLLAVPATGAWILAFGSGKLKRRVITAALFGMAAAACLIPWAARNYTAHHALVLTSTNGGLNFWIGNNPQANGEYTFPLEINDSLVRGTAAMSETARDRYFYEQGLAFIRDNPEKELKLAGLKLIYYWFFRPNIGSNYTTLSMPVVLAGWVFVIAWLVLLPLGIAGARLLRKDWRLHGLLGAILVSQSLVYMVYFVGTRYRTPADSFVIIWAAAGLSWLWSAWRQTNRRPVVTNG